MISEKRLYQIVDACFKTFATSKRQDALEYAKLLIEDEKYGNFLLNDDKDKIDPYYLKDNKTDHVADLTTLHMTCDGSEVYLDVTCGICGSGGCLGTVEKIIRGIQWDTDECEQ